MIGQTEQGQNYLQTTSFPDIHSTQAVFSSGLSMIVANRVLGPLRNGWNSTRRTIENEIQEIIKDPFGQQSIDPSKDHLERHRPRTVTGSTALSEQFGVPIAVKGIGLTPKEDPKREDLIEQFKVMSYLGRLAEEKLTPDQRKTIDFAKVYGAVRYSTPGSQQEQEWLFMEQIVKATRVETHMRSQFKNSSGHYNCFDQSQHLELVSFIGKILTPEEMSGFTNGNFVRFEALRRALQKIGIPVKGIVGKDLLYSVDKDGRKFYKIIDLKKKDLTSIPDFLK